MDSTPSAVRRWISCGSCRPSWTCDERRGATHDTSTTGERSSHGTTSNSWIAEPVIENSDVAFGAPLTPRLMLCTSTGAPTVPSSIAWRSCT